MSSAGAGETENEAWREREGLELAIVGETEAAGNPFEVEDEIVERGAEAVLGLPGVGEVPRSCGSCRGCGCGDARRRAAGWEGSAKTSRR